MKITELNGKKICILGFGKEGQSALRALQEFAADASITISDKNPSVLIDEGNIEKQLGDQWLNNLDQFDVIIKSPGIPPTKEIEASREKVTSTTKIFLDTVKEKNSVVIGVTGSKGKSTTASLIAHILKSGGKDAYLVGNIGIPSLDLLKQAKAETIFVQEMSSFQLMDLTVSPEIAVITSFFPDHLDYHGSVKEYLEAKRNITKHQKETDQVFYGSQWKEVTSLAESSSGKKHPYSKYDSPVDIKETKLLGSHNLCNIAGAYKVALHLGVSERVAIEAIKTFEGLPHRLQLLGSFAEINWVDDAISTTPESTIAALEALEGNVETLICGGQDRGNDFSELGTFISGSNIKTVIVFPESGIRIKDSISNKDIKIIEASNMEQAVSEAKTNTSPNRACLLSPASPSYNMYKNFEEKGEVFKSEIIN